MIIIQSRGFVPDTIAANAARILKLYEASADLSDSAIHKEEVPTKFDLIVAKSILHWVDTEWSDVEVEDNG